MPQGREGPVQGPRQPGWLGPSPCGYPTWNPQSLRDSGERDGREWATGQKCFTHKPSVLGRAGNFHVPAFLLTAQTWGPQRGELTARSQIPLQSPRAESPAASWTGQASLLSGAACASPGWGFLGLVFNFYPHMLSRDGEGAGLRQASALS